MNYATPTDDIGTFLAIIAGSDMKSTGEANIYDNLWSVWHALRYWHVFFFGVALLGILERNANSSKLILI